MPSKKSDIQFYADECFPLTSSTYLKSKGFSIIHAYDKGYIQKKDGFHLKVSKRISRVLITLDRDFLYYDEVNLKNHPGVIIVSVGSATSPNVNRVLDKALIKINKDYTKNSLILITDRKIIKNKNGVKTEKAI